MTLEEWRNGGRTYVHRGHEIFYRDEGDGPPLVLIHGFPTASWDWNRIWPALRARFRVVAPDLIGFGFSAKPAGYPYSIFDQAQLVVDLVNSLGIRSAHVLAHDYGDTVAQELLARDSEGAIAGRPFLEIASMCFLNGGLFPETHRARPVQKLLAMPVVGALLSRLSNRKRFAVEFARVFGSRTQPSRQEMDEFWHLVRLRDGHRRSHELIHYMEERRKYRERWVGALVHTRVPLRVIDGPADPVSGRHMAERYRELVPRPDVVILDDAIGHYPQVEAPQAVLEYYLAFLARRP
jgi:pimeloyl-ACP methyl ester carboxylesterase